MHWLWYIVTSPYTAQLFGCELGVGRCKKAAAVRCSRLQRRPPPPAPCHALSAQGSLQPTQDFVTPAPTGKWKCNSIYSKARGVVILQSILCKEGLALYGFWEREPEKNGAHEFSRSHRQWTIKSVAVAFPLKFSPRPPATSPEFNSGAGKGRELCGLRRPFKANLPS